MTGISSNPINTVADKGLVRLWLLLAVAAAGSLADVAEYAAKNKGIWAVAGVACVGVLKATALTALYAVCRRNKWLKWLSVTLIAVFILLSLLNGGCWLFYGFGISMKLLKIIAETNPTEVGEFLPELGAKLTAASRSPWLWIGLAGFTALWIWLPKIKGKWLVGTGLAFSAAGLVYLGVVVAPAEFGRTTHSVFARSGRCVAKYICDVKRIRELQARKRPLPYPETLESTRAAKRMVVVIGESVSREHLSLYGYPLPTSPRMDSIRNDLYVFDDAVASSSSTAENMPRLLTFMTDEPGGKEWYEYPSLLQIFRQLGYRTYWLSNQEYSGQWSNLSSILSADADILRYVGSMDSDDHYLYRYDDALMPEWMTALEAGDSLQLTFLHLMGSHFQYYRRFPQDRSHFSADDVLGTLPRKWLDPEKAKAVANYDNSIFYTDSILSVVLDGVRGMKEPAVMVYLSDHGEDVYDDRDYRGRDPKFVSVPFVVYLNDAYLRENPDIVADIEAARTRAFSTSELPQMLMHLSGTRYHMYDSVRDPLSKDFRTRKRWVDEEVFYRDTAH